MIAWEWLRRDPLYRRAAAVACRRPRGASEERAAATEAGRWGLHAFEWPDLAAPAARPVWRADIHPFVLPAKGLEGGKTEDRLDPALFEGLLVSVADREGQEHLLISDGLRSIRIDMIEGSLRAGPVRLGYALAGLASAEGPLLTLRRLLAFVRLGRFADALHPLEPRIRRWVMLLRVHDALAAGADQRRIAAQLLDAGAVAPRWRVERPSIRSQVQRLVRDARLMAGGEYRALLG